MIAWFVTQGTTERGQAALEETGHSVCGLGQIGQSRGVSLSSFLMLIADKENQACPLDIPKSYSGLV